MVSLAPGKYPNPRQRWSKPRGHHKRNYAIFLIQATLWVVHMLLVVNWNERINYVAFKAQKVAMIKNSSINSNIQIIDSTDMCAPSHDPIDKLTIT